VKGNAPPPGPVAECPARPRPGTRKQAGPASADRAAAGEPPSSTSLAPEMYLACTSHLHSTPTCAYTSRRSTTPLGRRTTQSSRSPCTRDVPGLQPAPPATSRPRIPPGRSAPASATGHLEPRDPPAAPPPRPPPHRQAVHQVQPPAALPLSPGLASLGYPGATAVGDLDPHRPAPHPDRDRHRLPRSSRAAVPHAVPEQLAHHRKSIIPVRVPLPEHPAHELPGHPRPLSESRERHALPHHQPSHRAHRPSRPSPPGNPPRGDGTPACTLDSAPPVKPTTAPPRPGPLASVAKPAVT